MNDNKPNNLPPEGWVLEMEHDHPRKDEVVKWLSGYLCASYTGAVNFYYKDGMEHGSFDDYKHNSFYKNDCLSHLPRLSMDDFIARTVDYKGEVKVGDMVEASDTADFYGNVVGELLFVVPEKYSSSGKRRKYLIGIDALDWGFYRFIRPIQPLTYTLAEARAELEKLKERPVVITDKK